MDVPPRNPAQPHALSVQEARKAPSGVPLSLVTFLSGKREKVTRAPKARETLLIEQPGSSGAL
jgi:hypothetical protein